MEKYIIEEEVYYSLYHWKDNIFCAIDDMISDLTELKNMGATNVVIKLDHTWGGEDCVSIKPIKKRLETDEEFNERVEKENRRLNKTKEQELNTYNKIKQKYGL